MIAFKLPELDDAHQPSFTSARACRDWLAVQPMANPGQAQTLLLRQINLLNRYAAGPGERLKMLELLRDPVAFVQAESARKFTGRPLPLAEPEQAGLDTNRSLWQAMQTGYLHCLQACLAGNSDVSAHAALAAQRAIAALRAELIDTCRAAMDPPAGLWQTLHNIYAAAEQLDAVAHPVTDSLQTKHPATSVAADFAKTLLLNRARPVELSVRQLLQAENWLQRWGNKVTVLDGPPADAKAPPLIVDLAGDQPEVTLPCVGGDLRWLDLAELSHSIKKRLVRLQRGESPASLGLGSDCLQPACENLLKQLYQQWFKGGAARQLPRHAGKGVCNLVCGFDAIHYYLSGRIFRQPGQGASVSKQQADEIATFGRVATRHEDNYSKMHGYMVEEWQVLDQSAAGLRLARSLTQAGERIGAGQLVAIRSGGARGFLLAVTRWSRIAGGSELLTGIHMLPGTPQPVALRGTGLSAANEKYRQGFVLPAVPALKEPESVIVPAGWFRGGRIIELYIESSRQIRLTKVLERGSDFERATFDYL